MLWKEKWKFLPQVSKIYMKVNVKKAWYSIILHERHCHIVWDCHFRNLREMFKLDAAEYMMSICGDDGLRELSSPGKSGSIFYLSHDDRFVIKTLKKFELKVWIQRTFLLNMIWYLSVLKIPCVSMATCLIEWSLQLSNIHENMSCALFAIIFVRE